MRDPFLTPACIGPPARKTSSMITRLLPLAFLARYPHAKNKTYDPWVEKIAKGFKPFLK